MGVLDSLGTGSLTESQSLRLVSEESSEEGGLEGSRDRRRDL